MSDPAIMRTHVDAFLNYLSVERGASAHTLNAYRSDLGQFLEYAGNSRTANLIESRSEHSDEHGLKSGLVAGYLEDLSDRGYTASTRARKIAALKSLFKFMKAEGVIDENPVDAIRSPRIGRSLPKALAVEQITELLDEVAKDKTSAGVRDSAMLELMYAGGFRVSELVGLDIRDVDLDEMTVRCTGKGAKERLVPIHPDAIDIIRHYIRHVRGGLENNKSGAALFLNQRGARLTRQGFWLRLKESARRTGIEETLTPHTLRHTFATHLLHGGASLRHVQDLLGHASIATTQIYTHLTTEHVRREYEAAHPRADA